MKAGFSLLLRTTEVTPAHHPLRRDLGRAGYDGAEIPITGSGVADCAALGRVMAEGGPVNYGCLVNYGYLSDTFHATIEERDPVGAITATAGALAYVHVSENDRGRPGRGHIDFAALFAALAAVGYDGWITVEAFGQALPDLAAATRVWRPLFGSEAKVDTEGLALIRKGWAAATTGRADNAG